MKFLLSGYTSRYIPNNTVVSQGSIIGHTLFLIIINDLPNVISSQLRIYDDSRIIYTYLNIKSVGKWGEEELANFNYL